MKPQIDLIRAVGSEFARRKLRPIIIIFSFVAVAVIAGAVWLINISAWWWLLAVPAMVAVLLGLTVLYLARVVVKALRPRLTKTQAKAVSEFVGKMERTAEALQTPMFIIVFRVVWDVIRSPEKSYIATVAEDSTTLSKDLIGLQKLFK